MTECTPESCKGSKQWLKPDERAPKRPKTQQSFGIFEKRRKIIGAYYGSLLNRLVDEMWRKWAYLKEKKIYFYDDNAPSRKSNLAQAKKHELCCESLPHPSCYLDLASSDYYLFPNLKRWLSGRRFESNEGVEWETEGYFRGFDKSYYLEVIKKLKNHWFRIELKGENIEE